MRRRRFVERRDEPNLLLADGIPEAFLLDVRLQAESWRCSCGAVERFRAVHPMQRELTHVFVVLESRDEVQHVLLRHEAERVDPSTLGFRSVAAAIVGFELSAL